MSNPESLSQTYFKLFSQLIEILNATGSYYVGYLNQGPVKAFITIQIANTIESYPVESFIFYRSRNYNEEDYKEAVQKLHQYINDQRPNMPY